jgi:hypothetical protein
MTEVGWLPKNEWLLFSPFPLSRRKEGCVEEATF